MTCQPTDPLVDCGDLERALARALADEISSTTNMLSDMAYDLGSDESVLRKHMGSLQSVDLITQILLTVADMLRAEDGAEEKIARVPLECLAARLKSRLQSYRSGLCELSDVIEHAPSQAGD